MWSMCHIEKFDDGFWYFVYPDGSKADIQNYKSKGSASKALNFYKKEIQ